MGRVSFDAHTAQPEAMANRAIRDDGLALSDLDKDVESLVRHGDQNRLSEHGWFSTDRNELAVFVHADRDVTSEAEYPCRPCRD